MVVLDDILEPKEVAQILKINYRTVIRLAERGELPGFKIGDLWRFRRSDLVEHIEKQVHPKQDQDKKV